MSPPESTPIVLVGLTARFGNFVSRKLRPDYEVIHFVSDLDEAIVDLKLILNGGEPTVRDGSGVSSGNFSQLPRHIVLGKSFQLAELEKIREAVGGAGLGLCWYWAPQKEGDLIIRPDELSQYPDPVLDKISDRVAGSMKEKFIQVIRDGKEGMDGIYLL